MTSEQFAYWLQGFAELHETPPTAEQWQSIREHLALVFTKVTPTLRPVSPLPLDADRWAPPHEVRCAVESSGTSTVLC